LTFDGLTIEGYSRAAVQSYWRIGELRLLFDMGLQPWDFMGVDTCFITHAHLDHIAALPVYVARRRMMKMSPPTIYLPAPALPAAQMLLKTISRLDRGSMPCELIGVEAGDEISLGRELVVQCLPTVHTVPSLAFVVYQLRRKLKPEFQGLQGHEIRDLRLQGVEVTQEIRLPWLAYTGDTAPQAWDQHPVLMQAKVLITEMTFVAPSHRKEKIHKHGHSHLDDWVARRDAFRNERIIASHFSTRYGPKQIQRLVQRSLPDMLEGRLHLWI
jgi:ribonuclease Z